MCGLVAVFGNIDSSDKERFKELLDVGKIRGEHATGISSISRPFKVGSKPIVSTFKKAMHGSDFIEYHSKDIDRTMFLEPQGLLGHNRWKTSGENTDDNAHPYTFGSITGMHNGIVSAVSSAGFPTPSDYPVDSQRLYYSLAHSGVDRTIENSTGDWALIWFDESVKKFFFLRNGGRDLYYRYADNKQTLWVMSESEMGEWILGRSWVNLDDEGWQQFKVNQLYSLDAMQTTLELKEEREVKGDTVKPQRSNPVPAVQQYATFEEWAARNNPKPETVSGVPSTTTTIGTIQLTPQALNPFKLSKGEAYLGNSPIFMFAELCEMELSSLKTLHESVVKDLNEETTRNALNYIALAKHNWSEKITWRMQHRQKVVRDVTDIEKSADLIKRLQTYANIIKGRITARELATPTIKPPTIELFTDIMARVVRSSDGKVVDRHNLYSKGSRNIDEWMTHLKQAVEDNQQFVGAGHHLSFDNDLPAQINICWTANQDVNNSEHRETCKKVHRMLDYLVSTKLKHWDRNYKRQEYFNNFLKAVHVRSYGLDWSAPSSKNFDPARPLFARVLYNLIIKAVQWGLSNYHVHPAIIDETLYKLEQPHPMADQQQEAAA